VSRESTQSAPQFIWNGIFPTWQAACEAGDRGLEAFDTDRWLDRVTQHLLEYRAAVREHGTAMPPRPSNLPWIVALTGARRILDLGGSSGWTFEYLRNTLVDRSIDAYVIIEIERMVAAMTEAALHGPPVRYQTSADSVGHCDVLYSNSVIQYFESNEPLISLIRRSTPDHILLDDVFGKGDDDFFSTQAYYGKAIPHRFIGVQRLISEVGGAGYQLIARAAYAAPILGVLNPLPMENMPREYQVRHPVSLLFRRNS
jgi:putative methyltransferase (TIGR04325 family)